MSGCKGVLLRNSERNSGVLALGTDSGRTGSVRTLELNSGRSEGASDACVFFADVVWELMKSRIQTRRGRERVTNLGQMKVMLKAEWERITVEEINKEIAKLPIIMMKCSEKHGGNKFHA